MEFKTPEEEYSYHLHQLIRVCSEQGWGDQTSYARAKKMILREAKDYPDNLPHHDAADYLYKSYDKMVETADTRELGKLFAIPSEYWQKDWINSHTSLSVSRREDVEKDCDKNQAGYDLLSTRGLRIQCKFRAKVLHLENTRRNSKKNQGAASTSGHVAYSVGECDVFCFARPNDDYKTTEKWKILAIPAAELEDPGNPGFIRRSVPKKIERKFIGRAKEVLEEWEAKR